MCSLYISMHGVVVYVQYAVVEIDIIIIGGETTIHTVFVVIILVAKLVLVVVETGITKF